jgi:hypothetical protein
MRKIGKKIKEHKKKEMKGKKWRKERKKERMNK